MNKGDYAVYSISVVGAVKEALRKAELPESYIQQDGDSFSIPRLCTFWRGDEAEQVWQDGLRAALLAADDKAEIVISAAPWQILPSYPQGNLEL